MSRITPSDLNKFVTCLRVSLHPGVEIQTFEIQMLIMEAESINNNVLICWDYYLNLQILIFYLNILFFVQIQGALSITFSVRCSLGEYDTIL